MSTLLGGQNAKTASVQAQLEEEFQARPESESEEHSGPAEPWRLASVTADAVFITADRLADAKRKAALQEATTSAPPRRSDGRMRWLLGMSSAVPQELGDQVHA